MLEVYELAQGTKASELDSVCGDLISSGAKLHVVQNTGPGGDGKRPALAGCAAIALFDTEVVAQKALAAHTSTRYKLRLSTRQWETPTQDAPSWKMPIFIGNFTYFI